MAFASSRIAPSPPSSSSSNGLDIATSRCRPVSAHPHRPLRFPYVRLQLKTARSVAASASASPPAILERKPTPRPAPSTEFIASPSALQALHSHHKSPGGALQSLVQSLEETFRNSPNGELCKRWRDYHGCSNWAGLLSPLDPDLRAEILKYGDLAQLSYDAFDNQEHSQTRGDCLYEEQELLQRAGLTRTGYQVTKYIYATSDVHVVPKWLEAHGMKGRNSNWMGFVAVATDEKEIARLGRRDIVVVWRGTVTRLEWLEDIDGAMVNPVGIATPADESHFNSQSCHVGVERGFYTLYTTSNIDNNSGGHVSAAEQVRDEVKRLVDLYRGGDDSNKSELSITMTGHSLGGALALLAAYDVASTITSCLHQDVPVSVVSFAAPRVGNEAFKRRLEEVGVKVLRVVNIHDMVPKVPGIFVHDGEASSTSKVALGSTKSDHQVNSHDHHEHTQSAYVHVGVELRLDNHYSPFLKKNVNLVDSHNLELYLHLVDGYRSSKLPFIGLHVEDHMSFDHGFTFKLQPLAVNDAHHQLDTIHFCMRFMKRDVALVNKTTGLLLDELHVLAKWQEKKLPRPSPRLSPSTITTRTTPYHVIPEFLRHFTRATNLIPTA